MPDAWAAIHAATATPPVQLAPPPPARVLPGAPYGLTHAVPVPEPSTPPLGDLITGMIRRAHDQAARALADAPTGARCTIALTADTPGDPVELGRYEFTRTPDEEITHG